MAFWDYNEGVALTLPCDDDVKSICEGNSKRRNSYTIGLVGRCLSKQMAQNKPLSNECRKLVTAAAPKDVRIYLLVRFPFDARLSICLRATLAPDSCQICATFV
jgi:hypothetical protein